MCEILKLDQSFQIYFTTEKFCDSCVQNVLNIDFTLKALSNLNSTLARTRGLLTGLLEENYERVTGGPHIPAVKLSKNVISYNNAVKAVFEALKHPDTEETVYPSSSGVSNEPEISERITTSDGFEDDACSVEMSDQMCNKDFKQHDQLINSDLIKSEIPDNEENSGESADRAYEKKRVIKRRVSAHRVRTHARSGGASKSQDVVSGQYFLSAKSVVLMKTLILFLTNLF